jgi:hypothetical protein
MYVEFDWPEKSEHNEFCVGCYGKNKSYFLRDEAALYSREELLTQLMASCAEKGLAE